MSEQIHPSWFSDTRLVVVSDDPDDGPSLGPPPDCPEISAKLGIKAVVIWSGAWDEGIWEELTKAAFERDMRVMIILTQMQHHDAWAALVRGKLPLLELRPDA